MTYTAGNRQLCDYPKYSVRGFGHPLACNCLSGHEPPKTKNTRSAKARIFIATTLRWMAARIMPR